MIKTYWKKFIIIIGILFLLFSPTTFWVDNGTTAVDNWPIAVTVTEKIPWMDCSWTIWWASGWDTCSAGTKGCVIKCQVPKGSGAVLQLMGTLIKYITFLAGLGGVLYIVINGILLSMSGLEWSAKWEIKKRISWTLVGLVLLLLSWVILNMIAPWVYK